VFDSVSAHVVRSLSE